LGQALIAHAAHPWPQPTQRGRIARKRPHFRLVQVTGCDAERLEAGLTRAVRMALSNEFTHLIAAQAGLT
jgi:hypothetical protein